MQQDFIVVHDERGARRFKIRFPGANDFFQVTVAKLRRSIASSVPSTMSDPDPTAFSLVFADDVNEKGVPLPEGALAEHALVADWGVRPGDTISLVWRPSRPSQSPKRGSSSSSIIDRAPEDSRPVPWTETYRSRGAAAAAMTYESAEVISTPPPAVASSHRGQFADPASSSSLVVASKKHAAHSSSNGGKHHDAHNDDDFDMSSVLADPNLTAEQRELQLKWLRECNMIIPAVATIAVAATATITAPPSKPPLYGGSVAPFSVSPQQIVVSSPREQFDEYEDEADHADQGLDYAALPPLPSLFTAQHQQQMRTQPPPSHLRRSAAADAAGLEYDDEEHGEEDEDGAMEYSADRRAASSSAAAAPVSAPRHADPRMASALVDADRRENARLRAEVLHVQAEADTWRERAQQALASLEQKLEFSVVGSPDSRRALAAALVDMEGLRRRLDRQARQLSAAQASLEAERQVRRALQREVEALRGNIRVIVRIRGDIAAQQQRDATAATATTQTKPLQVHGDGTVVTVNRGVLKPRGEFEFFRVLPPSCTQQELFAEQILPLVDMAVQTQRSLSVISYGASCSGKSFTVFSAPSSSSAAGAAAASGSSIITPHTGIALRTAKLLLDLSLQGEGDDECDNANSSIGSSSRRRRRRRFDVGVSVIELYCDELRDLLRDSANGNGTESMAKASAAAIAVFRTEQEAAQLIQRGADRRLTGSTLANTTSSRSHCLVTFHVTHVRSEGGTAQRADFKIVLADLAGSERLNRSGSSGQRLLEAQFINKSLSALGDVVHALTAPGAQQHNSSGGHGNNARPKRRGAQSPSPSAISSSTSAAAAPFVPFRNSSLTMLLQDAMSGSATTIFIACVVNEEADAEETYATLSFASRVRCVKNVQFTRGEMSLSGGGGGGAASSRALAAAAPTLTYAEPDEIAPEMGERVPPPSSQKQHVLARRALNPILTNCTVNAIAQQSLSAAQPAVLKQSVVESAPPPPTVAAAAPRPRRSTSKPHQPNVVAAPAALPAAPTATVESSSNSSRTPSSVSFVPPQAHAPQESAAIVAARQRTAAVLKRVAFDTDPRTVSVPTTRMSLLQQPQHHAGEILAPPEDSALAPAAQGSMSEAARLKSLLATRKRSPGRASVKL